MWISIVIAGAFLLCAIPGYIVAYAVGGGSARKQRACTERVTGHVVGMSNISSNNIRLPKVEYTVKGQIYTIAGPTFAGRVNRYVSVAGHHLGEPTTNLTVDGELPSVVKTIVNLSAAQRVMAERYPIGKEVDVFFDPAKPKRAYVERFTPLPALFAIWMPLGLSVVLTIAALIILACASVSIT